MNWQKYLRLLPRQQFVTKYARSSGPGGQNVNKLNTKVTIKLPRDKLITADWLEPELRGKISSCGFKYTTAKGDLIVTSELTRSQRMNLEDCYQKLSKELAKAAFVPRKPSQEGREKWNKLSDREERRKKEVKKRHSTKKKERVRF